MFRNLDSIVQHGPSIGPNMTQDEHSQAPKFWVANIFPIQRSQSNTRNKPSLKMEVHKSNFEDADFDLSIFGNFHLKRMYVSKMTIFYLFVEMILHCILAPNI